MAVIVLSLLLTGIVRAQSPTATPTPTLSPGPTNTPITVLIVTPAATPTPVSLLPEPVQKALKTLSALWAAFRWLTVPILLLAAVVGLAILFGKSYLEELLKKLAKWAVQKTRDLLVRRQELDEATKEYLTKGIINQYEKLDLRPMKENIRLPITLESVYVPLLTARGPGTEGLPVGPGFGLLVTREERERLARLDELLPEERYLVIIGPAGTGKSTFAKYVALTLARALHDRKPEVVHEKLGWKPHEIPLPVLIPLGGFGEYLGALSPKERAGDKSELLLDYLDILFAGLHLPRDFFRSHLDHDRCLMLWDGLDEIAGDTERAAAAEVLTAFAHRYDGCRYVATCRPEGYQDAARLPNFCPAKPAPFRPEEIRAFVHLWYQEAARIFQGAKPGEPTPACTQEEAENLVGRIAANPAASAMAQNPLLLTVITLVHFAGEPLPDRRAKLYSRAVGELLTWDKYKPMEEYPSVRNRDEDTRRQYLEEVAFDLQEQGSGEAEGARSASCDKVVGWLAPNFRSGDDPDGRQGGRNFFKWVLERSYLMQMVGGRVEFPHRAFQEYLAARHLAKRDSKELVEYLQGVLGKSWWEETLLLTPAHLSQFDRDKARHVIQATANEPDSSGSPYHNLVLAARALADVERTLLGQELERATAERLVPAIADENPAFAVPARIQAGEALGTLGDTRPGVCTPAPDWVRVPAGAFLMGSPTEEIQRWKKFVRERIEAGDYTRPENWTKERLFEVLSAFLEAEEAVHEIHVPGFCIARYPVTNAQFNLFIEGEGYNKPEYWTEAGWKWRQGEGEGLGRPAERRDKPMFWHDPRFSHPNQPVVGITWYEASAYCGWLTERLNREDTIHRDLVVRLPTEAEWEKAARGALFLDGDETKARPNPLPQRIWTWGNDWDQDKANTWEGRARAPTPVGLYPAGQSPYGVLDMVGNVWEWTNTRWGTDPMKPDYASPYQPDAREDPTGVVHRVLRGGSWDYGQDYARCACRYGYGPDAWRGSVGFRVVAPAQF
jgi:formylglycine-generating enzyme required for sulfatase activity